MKYVVELFDGKKIRGLLMSKPQINELMAKMEQLDPALGVVILDMTPEHLWKAAKRMEQNRKRSYPCMDLHRTMPLDRLMA
ncbi:MAG: hypothetical protein H7839_15920 [Magnetococcus sp. YQC-5]